MGLAGLVGWLWLSSCATTQPDAPPPPAATYEEEVTRASRAIADQKKKLRYNPVQCTCPAFEVELGPRWVRVAIEGLDDIDSLAAGLKTRAVGDHRSDRLEYYEVLGDLSTSPEYCGQGALYLRLSIEAIPPGR